MTFQSNFSIKSDQVYLSEQDDLNLCLTAIATQIAVIFTPLFSSSPLTIDRSVASFRAGSHLNIACGRQTGHRSQRITHPAARTRCRKDLVSFRRNPSRWWLIDTYVVMPPLSTLARATSICTIVPQQTISHTESCPPCLPTPRISVWRTVHTPMYTGTSTIFTARNTVEGSLKAGLFRSFMTPTISSVQNTQPGFQTILLGEITLLTEIRLNGQSAAVQRRMRGTGIRGLYCAELEGRNTGRMIVAIYQRDGAEEVS
jgi:hypothetical protein